MASAYSRSASPPRVQLRQIRPRAEIRIEQEALLVVALHHARRVHADVDEHRRDADVRLHVLLVRRRIHRDPGVAAAGDAEVAAEARVRRGGASPGSRASRTASPASARVVRAADRARPRRREEKMTRGRCSGMQCAAAQMTGQTQALIIIAADATHRAPDKSLVARAPRSTPLRSRQSPHAASRAAPPPTSVRSRCGRPAPRAPRRCSNPRPRSPIRRSSIEADGVEATRDGEMAAQGRCRSSRRASAR